MKELIDWDQQRLDVEVKYQQVMEQFLEEGVAPPNSQALVDQPQLPSKGGLRAANLALVDESGTPRRVSFEASLDQHVAIVGRPGSGAGELARLLARLHFPSSGSVEIGGIDITRAPEAVTGRSIGYVGSRRIYFPRACATTSCTA